MQFQAAEAIAETFDVCVGGSMLCGSILLNDLCMSFFLGIFLFIEVVFVATGAIVDK